MKKLHEFRKLSRAGFVKVYANSRGRRFVDADELVQADEVRQVLKEVETRFGQRRVNELPGRKMAIEQ